MKNRKQTQLAVIYKDTYKSHHESNSYLFNIHVVGLLLLLLKRGVQIVTYFYLADSWSGPGQYHVTFIQGHVA